MSAKTTGLWKKAAGLGAVALAFAAIWAGTGCETMNQLAELGTSIAVATGDITTNQAESINRTTRAVTKTFEDITPEQEYYIGRTVAATVLLGYKPLPTAGLNDYVNRVGQSLSQFSTRPETFGGYHFLVLDSADINAFAAPGGLILVTRGLLDCCQTEDELAAVSLDYSSDFWGTSHILNLIEGGANASLKGAFTLDLSGAGNYVSYGSWSLQGDEDSKTVNMVWTPNAEAVLDHSETAALLAAPSPAPVPEPSSALLVLAGLGTCIFRRRVR